MIKNLALVYCLVMLFCHQAKANDIPPMYVQVANENNVPASWFFAIAMNESQTSLSNSTRRALPWPWTINFKGKPYYFQTKYEAYEFALSLVEKGELLFDVGIAQVNWYWHKQRFANLWDAFEPYINLTAAAQHFREQYQRNECSTWELAVGCYHRPGQTTKDKKIAQVYRNKVIAIWKRI